MAIDSDTFFRSQASILADMIAAAQAAISDVYVGEDGVLRIIFTIESGQLENIYLANQLALEDMFVQTASLQALRQHGAQYGIPMKDGLRSAGSLLFTGAGGTYIPLGTEVGYDPGNGLEIIFFETTLDGTLPNPGIPTPPTVAVNATAGNLNGMYEYAVTFMTSDTQESLPSPISESVNPVNQQVNLTNIPIGGPGTLYRRIYRRKDGVAQFRRVAGIVNNTATTYTDNITDAAVASDVAAPTESTAEQITLTAQSQDIGSDKNVGIGTVAVLTNAPSGLTAVTNPTAFTGGDDPEDTEEFRTRLLSQLQNSQTGSPADLKQWAEAVAGVESATVFPNDNLGVATNGHVTVRISGPGGATPSGDVISAVADALAAQDLASIIIHVATFTPTSTNVTVDVTTSGTYTLTDVTPSVQAAIQDYINNLPVGGTLYLSGIVDAVFGLPGIADVVVTSPGSNQTTSASAKRTPGTITVT